MERTVISNFADFKNWIGNCTYKYTFDFETTSLNILDLEVLGFSMSDGKRVCYVRTSKPKDYFNWLRRYAITYIFHNAVFDLKVAKKYGFEPDSIICTLVGAKLIDSERGPKQYGLKVLEHVWLHRPQKDVVTYEKAISYGVNSPEFANYAMDDAEWTWKLWEYEKPIVKKQHLEYLFHDIEMPFQFVIRDMEMNGILIDQDELNRLGAEVQYKLIETESKLLDLFGMAHNVQLTMFGGPEYVSPINFGSSKQLADLIQNRLHFEVDLSDKGNPSVGNEYLLKMQDKHEFFKLMRKHRAYTKMYDAYIKSYLDHIDSDGRCRCSYHLIRSGRLSSSNPNHQQLPNVKVKKTEFNFRKIFVPEPENVFVKADYSGQELRLLGVVSKDEKIIQYFSEGKDLHLSTANYIFNLGLSDQALTEGTKEYKEACETYKTERFKAKNGVNFPVVYGTSPSGIASRMGVDYKEAKKWMDSFFRLYPMVKEAIEKTRKELEKQEYVETYMGRRRRFEGYRGLIEKEKAKVLRQAFNHKIQGFAADVGKIAGALLLPYLDNFKAKIVAFIHDEFVFEVPKEYAEGLSKVVKDVMENCIALPVKLIVDVKTVNTFGD
jgi:DNA polymerase I